MPARLRILKHTPQDGCSLQQYHPVLWASAKHISAQLVVWDNLRSQIFHRNKIDARGSIRKAPNVISRFTSLEKLRKAGDKDAGVIINQWNSESSKHHQIVGPRLSRSKCAWPDASKYLRHVCASGGEQARLGEMPLVR